MLLRVIFISGDDELHDPHLAAQSDVQRLQTHL